MSASVLPVIEGNSLVVCCLPYSQTAPAPDEQVVDQHYHGDDKQQMNETPCYVKAEAQKP